MFSTDAFSLITATSEPSGGTRQLSVGIALWFDREPTESMYARFNRLQELLEPRIRALHVTDDHSVCQLNEGDRDAWLQMEAQGTAAQLTRVLHEIRECLRESKFCPHFDVSKWVRELRSKSHVYVDE